MDLQTQRLMMAAAGAGETKPYIDDVFSTDLYKSTSSSADYKVTNNLDNSGEGAMLWYKERNGSSWYLLWDTERGSNKYIYSNSDGSESTSELLKSFDSDGYTIKGGTTLVGTSRENVLWNFRKAPGFFDVVTYTGNGTAGRTLSHSLGCVPGLVLIKQTNSTQDWVVYHRSLDTDKKLKLNGTDGEASTSSWNSTRPTSTTITLGAASGVNASSQEFVAYVFAGGESTAATARSVDFDDDDGLDVAASSDFNFGTGQFCIECWVNLNDAPGTGSPSYARVFQQDGPTGNSSFSNLQVTINPSNNTLHAWAYGGGNPVAIVGTKNLKKGWHHIAVVRDSNNLITQYVDGTPDGSVTATTNFNPNSGSPRPRIGSYDNGGTNGVFNGKISNLRVTVGEPVYTSAFKPSTTPLTTSSQVTSSSNVKLLCCNNSSTTGSTTTSGTITANGDPTASTDSPFADSSGFVFGENEDQEVIKCGSYVGNGASNGPEINLGWEPQWVLIKNTTGSPWALWDSMRGIVSGSNDNQLYPNQDQSEYTGANRIDLTSTGFKIFSTNHMVNTNNSTYVYCCIRRPDGYVGKPPELGTGVFAMDTGNGSSDIPAMDSGFTVDFALKREHASSNSWRTTARLIGAKGLFTDSTSTEYSASSFEWDSNVGWLIGASSSEFSWMWKRHAGFDVVTYKGNGIGGVGRQIPHSMNLAPQMIITKARNVSYEWPVWHIGLSAIGNNLRLNENYAELSANNNIYGGTGNALPTATHWTVGSHSLVNANGNEYISLLFSSVAGISKVGYYDGSESEQTITTGFQPRFVIIKRINNAQNWYVLDTTRGWASGVDQFLQLNETAAQDNSYDLGAPTSTGFTLTGNNLRTNNGGDKYIYYCHA